MSQDRAFSPVGLCPEVGLLATGLCTVPRPRPLLPLSLVSQAKWVLTFCFYILKCGGLFLKSANDLRINLRNKSKW